MTDKRSPRKIRLDELLVNRGLAESRSQARRLIMAGKVRLGDRTLDKPGRALAADADVSLLQPPRFVSRGGEKLVHFIQTQGIDFRGCAVLDIGASTGGFTDCALQAGAASVTCVDVGRAQLHPKIASDPRVTNLEKVNARHLAPGDLPLDAYDRIVVDVSFISLRLILPPAWPFLKPDGHLIALVKPQFEADRRTASQGGGVIRSGAIRGRILREIEDFALTRLPHARLTALLPSPILGGEGNQEYLLGLRKTVQNKTKIPFS